MRIKSLCAIAIPALSVTLVAQVPPGIVRQDASGVRPPLQNGLAPNNMRDMTGAQVLFPSGGANLQQVEFRGGQESAAAPRIQTGGAATGVWRLACTMTASTTTAVNIGQAGNTDVFEGVYNSGNDTTRIGNLAASFNTTGAEFAFSISNDGLFAVCDQAGGPVFATRTATALPWSATSTISGIPAGFLDSKLFQVGNTTWYAGVNGNNIGAGPINRTTGAVSNFQNIIVTSAATGNFGLHSHTPVTDRFGDVEGWVFSNSVANGHADSFFLDNINTIQAGVAPPMQIWDDNPASWVANSGMLEGSGSCLQAYSASSSAYQAPLDLEMVCITAGKLQVGPNNDLNLFVPWSATPSFAALMVGVTGPPINLSPVLNSIGNRFGNPRPPGQLGLSVIATTVSLAIPATGSLNIPINIGASFPVGVPVGLQFLALNTAPGSRIVTSNTARAVR